MGMDNEVLEVAELVLLLTCHLPGLRTVPDLPSSHRGLARLESLGLIELKGENWYTTTKGSAHVNQLTRVPLPLPVETKHWVDAKGNILAQGK